MQQSDSDNVSRFEVPTRGRDQALAYLLTSTYDLRLTQERHLKIQFHPLREPAGLSLERAA